MLSILVSMALVAMATARPSVKDEIGTVPELDTSKYVGRWYQVYGNRFGWFGYGSEAVCISATYTSINETAVDVLNANRVLTGDGEPKELGGVAWQRDPENEPGKLYVQLDNVPFRGDYWIVLLGPPTFMVGENSYYQWAVVSNPSREALYVLARDTGAFYGSEAERTVLAFLEREGFTDFYTRPLKIDHPANCGYPPMPPM